MAESSVPGKVGGSSGIRAFLIADVRGYTLFTQERGDEAAAKLAAKFAEAARAHVEERGGSVIELRGDEALAVFESPRQAIRAAVELQARFIEETLADPSLPLTVGIGLDAGEAVPLEQGYRGGALNLAARLCGLAEAGETLASQELVHLARRIEGVRFVDRGEAHFKGLSDPVRVIKVLPEGEDPALLLKPILAARTRDHPSPKKPSFPRSLLSGRRLLVAILAVALIAVGTPLVLSQRGAGGLRSIDANAVGLIDPETNRIIDQVLVGATPSHLAVGEGAVWVINAGGGTVSRIDPAKESVVQTISVGSGPSGIAVGGGAVWVANGLGGTVSRIDPGTNTVVRTIPVGNGPVGVVFGAGSLWVANTDDNTIARISAETSSVAETLKISGTELAFGVGALWASDKAANRVSRIDPATGSVVATIAVGNGPAGLAFGDGAAWIANTLDGTVSRIDPTANSVTATIPVGDGPSAIAVGAGAVWVSNEFGGTVVRIDPVKNQVVRTIPVGNHPKGVAVVNGGVLVSVLESGAAHRGGTLTIRVNRALDSIDTAIAYDSFSWSILNMTGDGLTGFVRAGGIEGTQLVPDLAVSLPAPTDGGKTYAFQLRPSIRYSTGALVKAADIRHTMERVLELGSGGAGFYEGIVGGTACAKTPERCDLSRGIVTGDATDTVTFHLTAPDPEFLYKLALPFAYAVPVGTPVKATDTRPLPATGPYAIESYLPDHLLRLARNRYFQEWSKPAQPDGYPDEIVVEIGGTVDAAMAAVEHGSADSFSTFQSGSPSATRLTDVETRYASQVHTNPQATTIGFFLNTRVPPFDDVNVRRAMNDAVDRTRAVDLAGGSEQAQPTCQILPPNFPGYRPYCPYTVNPSASGSWLAPDLAKARLLVAASGTKGMHVTVWSYTTFKELGTFAAQTLRSLGYSVSVKLLGSRYFAAVGDSRNGAQIGFEYWGADYPASSDFLNTLLSCGAYRPDSGFNQNHAEFCDPSIDREINRALSLQAPDPQAASELWRRVEDLTVDQAPWVPLLNLRSVDFLSKRMGDYQYSPQWGMLIDQLWVR